MQARVKRAVLIVIVALAVIISCTYIALMPMVLNGLMNLQKAWLATTLGKLFYMALFLTIALALFWFRHRERFGYGISEVIAGGATCWLILSGENALTMSGALGIGGGIYVMVRGVTNIQEGAAKPAVEMPVTIKR